MDKHVEEVKFIIQISEVIEEGLNHLYGMLKEGKENPPFFLLEDVIEGYLSIRESLAYFQDKLGENKIDEKGISFENELSAALIALKADDRNGLGELLKQYVIPAGEVWKKELNDSLSQYILC